ncbi:MAG: HAD family phosphatase [Ruminococcaceae bacterium]|nr:HAD family phosphatase [Oscillospiraceae bacterium]
MPQFDFDKNYIKYIIFDMDGVLINSEPVTTKAALTALSEIDISVSSDYFKAHIGAGEEKFITEPCKEQGKENLIPSALPRLYELFNEYVYTSLEVFPSVHKLLSALREKGFHLAIASSSASDKVAISLDAAKISADLFDVIITGSDVTEKKPSPEIYFIAMDELDADPEECLIIEDALNGIRSAKSSGAFCFAVTSSFPREALAKENPDFIGDDIIEVLDIL